MLQFSNPTVNKSRSLQTSCRAQAHPATIFAELCEGRPMYAVSPASIRVLSTPADFHSALKALLATAKRRIVLASLYIGTDQGDLIHILRSRLAAQPDLTLHILVDYFRGTRRDAQAQSTVSLLLPLAQAFPGRVTISLYHTPHNYGLLKRLLPARVNEGIGTMHLKAYAVDDELILSGANLSTDYFVNRQDRYMQFGSPSLTAFFTDLVAALSAHCFTVSPGPTQAEPPSPFSLVPPRVSPEASRASNVVFRRACKNTLETFLAVKAAETSHIRRRFLAPGHNDPAPTDVAVVPSLQLAASGICGDQHAMASLLASCRALPSSTCTFWLTSGYANFPRAYSQGIKALSAPVHVLIASPQANGFYQSGGISSYIPHGYDFFAHQFYKHMTRGSVGSPRVPPNRGNAAIEASGDSPKAAGDSTAAVHRDAVQDSSAETWAKQTPGKDFSLFEYIRPGWTYHAKGLWVDLRPPGLPESDFSGVTVLGSTNFSRRSLERDLEGNVFLFVPEPAREAPGGADPPRLLARALRENLQFLWRDSRPLTLHSWNVRAGGRRIGWVATVLAWLLRRLL